MQVTSTGSVRVDLLGGTLDLEPINLILPNVVTLNVATSLQAKVSLQEIEFEGVQIESKDYETLYEFNESDITDENLFYNDFFKEMTFVMQILAFFNVRKNIKVELSSGAPAGSGLGGSSAMGMTLYKALSKYQSKEYSVHQAVMEIKGIEGRILNQGVPGYQDYFPAMLGGILALSGSPGRIETQQLYSQELKEFLEKRITLVYSGISRNSGINNWSVYKGFFDGVPNIRLGLETIARLSHEAYKSIQDKKYENLLFLIGKEGESRTALAPAIVPEEVALSYKNLKEHFANIGLKMCGAGGGGCFILTHTEEQKSLIQELIREKGMKVLDFSILPPIKGSSI